MIDLRQLKLFSTVAEFGSFSRAAVALSISQPVLSRQVKVLESDLGVDAVFGYRHTVEPQRNEILGELRFNFSRDDTPNTVERTPGASDTRPHRLQDIDAHQDQNEYIATLDVIRPLTPTLKLETGYKGTMRRLDSEYEANLLLGTPLAPEPDSTTVNDFLYDEAVHAVYGVLSKDFGRFDAQAGLRAERTDTDFELAGDADTYENGYTSLFPSASLLYDLSGDGMQSLRASYSRRIRRPNARFLNPFPFVEDEFSEFRGNPELGPEYTDALELTWQRVAQWGTLQLTPFYRRQTDIIRRYVDTSGEVRRTTFINADNSDQYGVDATSSLRSGPFNGFLSLSAYQQTTDASNVEAGLGSETFTWNARLSLGYKLTESTSLQYFHFYRGAQELESAARAIGGVAVAFLTSQGVTTSNAAAKMGARRRADSRSGSRRKHQNVSSRQSDPGPLVSAQGTGSVGREQDQRVGGVHSESGFARR